MSQIQKDNSDIRVKLLSLIQDLSLQETLLENQANTLSKLGQPNHSNLEGAEPNEFEITKRKIEEADRMIDITIENIKL